MDTTISLARLPRERETAGGVREALECVLVPFGGLGDFVERGARVLIKPDQEVFRSSLEGATTSPLLVRQLIRMCFEQGAREVWVADAAGHGQQTRQVMERTGMLAAVKGTGAHPVFLDEIAQKVHDFGEAAGDLRWMPIPEILERADVMLNVPKARTGFPDPIHCACQNWVGVMPPSFRLHLQRLGDAWYRGTAHLLRAFRPALTIVDGVIAGQGQGPLQTEPFSWGWLLASQDPVAMDVTVCRMFGLEWRRVRMASEAAALGVGIFDPTRLHLRGARFEETQVEARPCDPGVGRYPCRVLVGEGENMEATLGHWKCLADAWLENGVWSLFTAFGTPTFMIGRVEDADFETHVRAGPYVVLGDACLDRYKYDPRVVYVPGSPVPESSMQHEMVEGMGFGPVYRPGLQLFQTHSSLRARLLGAAGRTAQARTMAKAFGLGALAVGLPLLLSSLFERLPAETQTAGGDMSSVLSKAP